MRVGGCSLRLEATRKELEAMAANVAEEQAKTDALLSELLPPTISRALRQGTTVHAGSSSLVPPPPPPPRPPSAPCSALNRTHP